MIDRLCQTADEVALWVIENYKSQNECKKTIFIKSSMSTKSTKSYAEYSANAVLVLLAVACALLDRQVKNLAEAFEDGGRFTERLYRVRKESRDLRIGR